MIIDLLLLTAIIVFVIDLSGFEDELEIMLAKWLNVSKVRIPKPFSCSLCTTWWIGLLWILCSHSFTLGWIAYVAVLAYLTPVIYNILTFIRDLLNKIIGLLCKFLGL